MSDLKSKVLSLNRLSQAFLMTLPLFLSQKAFVNYFCLFGLQLFFGVMTLTEWSLSMNHSLALALAVTIYGMIVEYHIKEPLAGSKY